MASQESAVGKYFGFKEHNTNFRTEFVAGLTTFLTMAYIIFVNPAILSDAGMDFGAVFVATVLAATIGSLIMGLYANYPIALAPGMGLNAYFAYTVVLGMNYPWQVALGAVFVSGIIFLLLTVTKLRETIINVFPSGLKSAVAAGIGLFIAFIGLKNASIVVANPATYVGLNPEIFTGTPLLTLVGIVIIALLMIRKVPGGIFIGMLITAVIGLVTGDVIRPEGFVQAPPSMAPTFMQMDVMGALELGALTIVFAFLFVDFFDTAGTLTGVAKQGNMLVDNKLPRAGRALTADSVATIAGAAFGTSTTTSYIESSAGVAAGGRTGMTAVVTGLLFLVSLPFFPIIKALALSPAVTSPVLIIVGVLMASSLKDIEWGEFSEAVPAFMTALLMPLSFSIATGIAFGFIFYPIIKLFAGKGKEVHPIVYIIGVLFVLRFLFLGGE
ncbi:guanine permease [Desulfuribacillus stibiiarsenatis]|uniref:Guanine permease n=1 Tax=Desulfuribacillus stibiiarsenatis TaxID=1390249 RepID=A0A1E5L5C4_9FIRM|nr:NCS2 family permease [Desulfuribacillus stibiiarsenatis]OEH85203.1 guanine permease [Desulfuribacillus stibiiarsenatis]